MVCVCVCLPLHNTCMYIYTYTIHRWKTLMHINKFSVLCSEAKEVDRFAWAARDCHLQKNWNLLYMYKYHLLDFVNWVEEVRGWNYLCLSLRGWFMSDEFKFATIHVWWTLEPYIWWTIAARAKDHRGSMPVTASGESWSSRSPSQSVDLHMYLDDLYLLNKIATFTKHSKVHSPCS